MNFNLPAVIMLAAGMVLMYGAVNNKDPRDVVREALGKKNQHGPISTSNAGTGLGKAAGGAINDGMGMGGALGGAAGGAAGIGPIVSV